MRPCSERLWNPCSSAGWEFQSLRTFCTCPSWSGTGPCDDRGSANSHEVKLDGRTSTGAVTTMIKTHWNVIIRLKSPLHTHVTVRPAGCASASARKWKKYQFLDLALSRFGGKNLRSESTILSREIQVFGARRKTSFLWKMLNILLNALRKFLSYPTHLAANLSIFGVHDASRFAPLRQTETSNLI